MNRLILYTHTIFERKDYPSFWRASSSIICHPNEVQRNAVELRDEILVRWGSGCVTFSSISPRHVSCFLVSGADREIWNKKCGRNRTVDPWRNLFTASEPKLATRGSQCGTCNSITAMRNSIVPDPPSGRIISRLMHIQRPRTRERVTAGGKSRSME